MTGKEGDIARDVQIDNVFHYVIKRCHPLWPGKVKILAGYSKGQYSTLLTLVAATGGNDQILPPEETIQELTDIMADDGFKGAPSWFVLAL